MADSIRRHDTPAEVDATFRTLRRVAVGHFVVCFLMIAAVSGLVLVSDWWSQGRLIGGMSPNFVMAAFGLYVFFFLLGLGAALLSGAVEARMLGDPEADLPGSRLDAGFDPDSGSPDDLGEDDGAGRFEPGRR